MSESHRDPVERAVAVIGMGAILPGAPDVPTMWKHVLEGSDLITEVPPDRWSVTDYYDPDPSVPGKTYSKIGGWVRDVSFESVKFRIPPKVAAEMDEGQKWGILAAAEALRDAGHPDRPLDLESTGVIVGNAMGGEHHYITNLRLFAPEYVHVLEALPVVRELPETTRSDLIAQFVRELGHRIPDTTEDTMPGELTNIMAGRIAAVFNLRGPNYTTDAACASSFAALDAAVQGLMDHHFDVALTGGMDRNMGATTFVKFCKIGALSPDGSRPYARGANGFVMGEGGALFVLKRLADAEEAGDRIYAVIRAVGASSDGKGKGITAPNPIGQMLAVKRAWQRAGLDPSTLTLLEGHGTSTRVGDVVEVESIAEVIREAGLPRNSIALGSIKSQIGHLKSAAGAAGLIKAVLAIHHGVLPPSINCDELNPNIDFGKTPFFVNRKTRPWERPANAPRRAGVSSFGFGGTNFHVVLEEHVPGMLTARRPQAQVPDGIGEAAPGAAAVPVVAPPLGDVVALGAPDVRGLVARLEEVLADARAGRVPERRTPGADTLGAAERLTIAFDGADDLVAKGERALKVLEDDSARTWRVLRSKSIHRGRGASGKVAFLFPGQGSQYVNMLAEIARIEPVVAETFAEADDVMTPILGRPLTSYLFLESRDKAAAAAAEEALRHTTICQPAVLACDMALTRLFARHGIQPDFVMGHSLGEWAAMVAADMMPFRDGLVGVSARAKGMASVSLDDPGKMASVLGPYEEIVARLSDFGGYVVAANINSRKQTVIAGASDAVVRAVDGFKQAGFTAQLVNVSHAFHSKIVAPAVDALRNVLQEMPIRGSRVPVVSNIDGEFYPTDDLDAIRDRIARQLASPVQFVKGLENLYEAGARVFVEVGPKRVLQGFAEDVIGENEGVVCMSSNHPKRGDVPSFHDAMCALWSCGLPVPPRPRPMDRRVPEVAAPSPVVPVAEPARDLPAARVTAVAPVSATVPASAPADGPDYVALGKLFAKFLDEGLALYAGGRPRATAEPIRTEQVAPSAPVRGAIVVSGTGLGLPGESGRVFGDEQFDRILRGESFLEPVPEPIRERQLEKGIVRLIKPDVGEPSLEAIRDTSGVVRLAGRKGSFDLASEFGIDDERAGAFDITTKLAVGGGIEALRDAGIPLVRRYRRTTTGSLLPGQWQLPAALADETGVIFAAAFPALDVLVDHVERFDDDKRNRVLLDELRSLRATLSSGDASTSEIDRRIARVEAAAEKSRYTFNRRFLFQVLVMGHSQFAELVGARGPNTHVNSACASTTQAVSLAEDWIRSGRCRRVIVVGADDITSDRLMGWVGSGFLATGAATSEEKVEQAALPFDRRRHGTLLGMGACGLVIESQEALVERGMRGIAEILATETANSAFHGTRLDVAHITDVMERLVSNVEHRYGISRRDLAKEMVFVSHETFTPARGGSAAAEIHALRKAFGADLDRIVIANTKGFTGHPQGVGIEDAVAVKILETGIVPPVPNCKEPDPELGTLNLSKGGRYPVRYYLRLAAGFGSQVSMTMARRVPNAEERFVSKQVYERWLSDVSGYPNAPLEVQHRTLRIRDLGVPAREPAKSTWIHGTTPSLLLQGGDGAEATIGEPIRVAAHPAPAIAPVPAAPAPSADVAPPPGPAAPATPAAATDPVVERVLALVGEKTGYPVEMLALDLDLEADLGIDTVKQAEVFAMVREAYDIPRQDDLKLRDYPTLGHVIGFIRKHRPDLAAPEPAPAHAPATAPAEAPAPTGDPVAAHVLALVSEKTGYPVEMLELDLDLEADLGIDTVKQAEVFAMVREAYDIPRQDDLKLRDYPTLGHVIGFIRKHRPDLAVEPAVAPSVESERPAAPAAAAPSPTAATLEDPVVAHVLALVSEKTGYPAEMLELDLDLEADLGIDTVKQAEVFAMVREAYDIPRQDDLKLRDYPTLGHVIGFIRKHRPDLASAGGGAETTEAPAPPDAVAATGGAAGAAPESTVAGDEEKEVAGATDLLRMPVPMLRPAIDLCLSTAVRLGEGRRVVVVADHGGVGRRLLKVLGERNVEVLLVRDRPDPRALEATLADWIASGNVAGAYFLTALDPDPSLSETDLEGWRGLHRERVHLLHALARSLYDMLDSEGSFLVAATRLGGVHGYEPDGPRSPSGGAVTGFVKALARERTNALVKVVDFDDGADADAVARALLAETERDPGAVEVGHRDGLRFAIGVRPEPEVLPEPRPAVDLGPDTVLVVTGSAGAVTTAIVRDLAVASQGTFHLLDFRPMPDEEARRDIARLSQDREGLQRELFARRKAEGGRVTPAQIEKELFDLERAGSILEGLREVEERGGKAFYHQVDATDAEAVAAVVRRIRDESGRIDVIVHAAGLERSRSLDKKPVEEFELVFGVKSDGLFNLLHATRDAPPRAVVCFSSVAGRFGNAGQADYSAGNDVMCKLAAAWGAAHPESLAIVLDWTAWGGIGMATRGSIPEMMQRAGIEMLAPGDGIPVVRRKLRSGFSGETVVGRKLGILLAPKAPDGGIDPEAMASTQPAGKRLALPFGAPSADVHDGLRIEVVVDPRREPFLKDHEIDGTPVLPGVMGLEAFAEVAALLCPGCHVEAIEDVRFHAPMKYYRHEPRPVVIRALPVRGQDGRIRIRASLSSTLTLVGGQSQEKEHFSACVVMAPGQAPETRPTIEPARVDGGGEIDREKIYRVYFHGPAYQVLSSVQPTSRGGLGGALASALPLDTASPEATWVFSPRLVELCFQTAGVWEIGASGQLGLPAALDRVSVWSPPRQGSPLVAEVSLRGVPDVAGERAEDGPCFDAIVRDEEGNVYVEVLGYRTARLPGALPEDELAPFRAVVPR